MAETNLITEFQYNATAPKGQIERSFDTTIKTLEKLAGGRLICDVTRRRLIFGTRDGTTGWRAKTYNDTTVPMAIFTRANARLATIAGAYVRYDAVGLTQNLVQEFDEIRHMGIYYEVKAVQNHTVGDKLIYRECHMVELSLHEEV